MLGQDTPLGIRVPLTVLSHAQLFSGPSLSVPGVAGSSEILYPLFSGRNSDNQVSPILDASSDIWSDAMQDIIGSEHSPAATCEFHFL
jgi:hypothetical protein